MRLPQWLSGKESTCNAEAQETQVRSLGWEDPLEEEMATHSSILAWRIPWTGSLVGYGIKVAKSETRLSNLACTHTRARMYMGRERERDVGLF